MGGMRPRSVCPWQLARTGVMFACEPAARTNPNDAFGRRSLKLVGPSSVADPEDAHSTRFQLEEVGGSPRRRSGFLEVEMEVRMNVGQTSCAADGGGRGADPPWSNSLLRFLLLSVLVCSGAGVGGGLAEAEDGSVLAVAAAGSVGGALVAGPPRTLSNQPAVVTVEPERIPNYRAHRTDITDAIQSAIDSTSGPLKVLIPPGYFVVHKGDIEIARDSCRFRGQGTVRRSGLHAGRGG